MPKVHISNVVAGTCLCFLWIIAIPALVMSAYAVSKVTSPSSLTLQADNQLTETSECEIKGDRYICPLNTRSPPNCVNIYPSGSTPLNIIECIYTTPHTHECSSGFWAPDDTSSPVTTYLCSVPPPAPPSSPPAPPSSPPSPPAPPYQPY